MSTHDEQDFLAAARARLEESVNTLDAHTLSRLHSARSRALDSLEAQPAWHAPRWWLPAGAMAAAAALVFVLGGEMWTTQPTDSLVVITPEITEIVGSEENLEIATDLDFYRWLDEQTRAGAYTATISRA
ncbi:MAG: hypothetical protein Q8L89_00350 [Gammaproteobacteria bacterium]|nr:hypothetical protein [Gammaproteobacteria bacterium]